MKKKQKLKLSDHYTYGRLIRFALPSIFMMLFTSTYTIVDGLFVSNLVGDNAFAALNLIWPVVGFLMAFGFMFGTGGSALVSKTLGEGKSERANEYFTMIVVFELIFGLIISLLIAPFIDRIAVFLGAGPELIDDAIAYGVPLVLIQPFVFAQVTFQSFMVVAEKPKLGLFVTLLAGISNMVLDWVFISLFNMGIAGAAWATSINWLVGAIVPMIYFARPNSSLLRFRKFHWNFKALWKSCTNGLSEMVSNMSVSFVSMLYNFVLLIMLGNPGVIAFGIVQYVSFLFSAVFFGYCMSVAPLISYNFGAANRKELKSLFDKSLILTTITSIAMLVIAELSAPTLAMTFVGYSNELMSLTQHAIHLYSLSFLLVGFNIYFSAFFTALNNGAVSALLSFLRTFALQTVCVIGLPYLFGANGIWLASFTAEIIALCIGLFFIMKNRKRYGY